MIEKTVYVANDGTEFEEEDECRMYELNINSNLPKFLENEVIFYDKSGNFVADLHNITVNQLAEQWDKIYHIGVASEALARFQDWAERVYEETGYLNLPYDCPVSQFAYDNNIVYYSINNRGDWICLQDEYREMYFLLNKFHVFNNQ